MEICSPDPLAKFTDWDSRVEFSAKAAQTGETS